MSASLEIETQTTTELSQESVRLTGCVKWFNTKAGFGFITVCDGDHHGKDIFVHYTAIQVDNSQYKYLVQGEYVDFALVKPENSDHEYHAVEVSGIKGGNLMCETRRLNVPQPPYHSARTREEGDSERVYVTHEREPRKDLGRVERVQVRYVERPVERYMGERYVERPVERYVERPVERYTTRRGEVIDTDGFERVQRVDRRKPNVRRSN